MRLKHMPIGSTIHNIELNPGAGGVLARSAGSSARLVARQEKQVVIKLPSKQMRLVNGDCIATLGEVSNEQHNACRLGKAGKNRWKGKKPGSRGVAMVPMAHAMGGGEGKHSGGIPRSASGRCVKGQKTRNKKKYSQKMILK